jgi:predicted HicB family RNase H-like nuclease
MANRINIKLKSRRSNTVLVCMDDELHQKISDLAERNSISLSSTCYEILNQTIDLVDEE